MNKLFDMQAPFWQWVGNIPHLIALSVLWVLVSLPVVTLFPASVALYTAVVKKLRTGEKGIYGCFFTTFRAECRRGIGLSLLWLGIVALFLAGDYILVLIADQSQLWAACMLMYPLLCIPPLLIFLWSIGVQARFCCSFTALLKNATVFAFSNKGASAIMLLILLGSAVLCAFLPELILIAPTGITVLMSLPIERVFRPYYSRTDAL